MNRRSQGGNGTAASEPEESEDPDSPPEPKEIAEIAEGTEESNDPEEPQEIQENENMNSISKYCVSLNTKQYVLTLFILGLIGLISLIAGLNKTWSNFVDFQQPAACLFIAGENPFLYHLEGLPEGSWSAPNYLHHLYVILSPLCLFNDAPARLVWGLINTALAVWCSFLAPLPGNGLTYRLESTSLLMAERYHA